MQWSSYQENIFKFVEESSRSAVINACSGSGKTTTIVECAKRAALKGKSILFLAFNKSIASELDDRMRAYDVECKTLHSHGFRAIMNAKRTRLKLNDKKWYQYLKDNLFVISNTSFPDKEDIPLFIGRCLKLFNLCRMSLLEFHEKKGISEMAFNHGIVCDYDEESVVSQMLEVAYDLNDNVVDFIDMITLPCMDSDIRRSIIKYDLIFVDECQDLSEAQQQLMMSSLKKNGRFIAVGDPRQSLYGFAGADCDSFYKLKKLADGIELPLSVCYRCGKDIVKLAQNIVPSIEAFQDNENGVVKTVKSIEDLRAGDFVLSRKAAPTVSLCLRLIASGKPAKVKGKDMMEGLLKLVQSSKAKTFDKLYTFLEKEYKKVLKRVESRGVQNPEFSVQAVTFKDKIECIRAIAEQCDSVDDIKTKMESMFSDYENGRFITLSTVHKAKGLEADRVFVLLPETMPLKWKGQKKWQLEQELNIRYVCITRAKKELAFVDLTLEELLGSSKEE